MIERAVRRIDRTWVVLSAVTLVSWLLGVIRGAGAHEASIPITVGVIAIALVKGRLVLREFMEVRDAPRWLGVFTDTWLVLTWLTTLAIYLYAA